MLGLPLTSHSAIGHTKEATAVASVVVVKALAAMPSAATALPALNPYHPTQSMPLPIIQRTILCGDRFPLPKPKRLSTLKHSPRAGHPPVNAPDHVALGEISEKQPADHKEANRRKFHALGNRAYKARTRDNGEHQLIHRVNIFRAPIRVAAVGRGANPFDERFV